MTALARDQLRILVEEEGLEGVLLEIINVMGEQLQEEPQGARRHRLERHHALLRATVALVRGAR